MKVSERINLDYNGLIQHGPINIVALGDSVTHGAVGPGEIDYESVFHNRLKKKILGVRNYVPVNIINAGIGGTTAKVAVGRLDSQVFAHNPDLVIICFGLNDVNGSLEEYIDSLRIIFNRCKKEKVDAIFMTPNMLNTCVPEDTAPDLKDYAKKTADMQNSGRMDEYIYSAIDLAKELDITVCDCYTKWKELSLKQNITYLLANRINHPVRDAHELFAQMLFRCIFPSEVKTDDTKSSTMWQE